ncbi:MAG: hypothetical protein EBR10_03330 [Planctomycetes bacterium]|nr:hypothetical protein [Planctomycetota bacterium]
MARRERNREGEGGLPVRVDPQDTVRLLKAMPPNAPEAESALLGCLLVEPTAIGDVVSVIRSAEDFFQDRHKVVYANIVDLYDRTASVDVVRLVQQLTDRKVLDAVGGCDYLIRLSESMPSAQYAMEYARTVRDKATLRQLIDASSATVHEAFANEQTTESVLEQAEQRIFAIAQRRESNSVSNLSDLLREAMERLEAREGTGLTGVGCGFDDIDEMTSGLQSGEMLILAARPSMGKTALALNMMEGVSLGGTPAGGALQLGNGSAAARAALAVRQGRRGWSATSAWNIGLRRHAPTGGGV